MDYQDIYKQGLSQGFHVNDVKTYICNDKYVVSMELATPFVSRDGSSVFGHAEIPVTHGKGLRDVNTVEFFDINGHNLDYMDDDYKHVCTKDGKSVSMETARKTMGQFASAASEYPYVHLFDEWKKLQERNHIRLRIPGEPTEADYNNYLDHVERQMIHKDVTFIGPIDCRTKLHIARESMPSFSEFMDDVVKSDDGYSID